MKRINLILLAICLLLISPDLSAQSLLNKIKKSGELRVGLTGTQPPFSMKTKAGGIIGYEVDLAELLASGMGVKVNYVEMPFADLIPALEKGEVDVVMSNITMTLERNMKVAFKGPYMISGKSILTKTPTLKSVTSPGEINNEFTKIAVLKSSTSEDYARENTPMAKITIVDDYDEGIELIRNGKVDLMIADFSICAFAVLTNTEEQFYTLNQPLSIEPVGLAMPASDPLFLNIVDNFFVFMQLNGTLDQLQQKWFNDGSWLDKVK